VVQASRFFALLLIALLGQATPVPPAQQQPPPPPPPAQQPPPQPPPRFRAETNFVRVDVYATKGGVAVQDLQQEDFDVAEDNVPQKIESFEHIVIEPAGPRDTRIEPSSPSQALQLVADPKRRVFVIFLDTHNVPYEGSHAIKEPLISFMQRVMGDDDLVALMTPDMSASELTFGRRTDVIEAGLRQTWFWGRRDTLALDDWEKKIADCFLPLPNETGYPSALAKALIQRRRERATLDALHDLVRYMNNVREGRTAVVAVSDGWLLFRPDQSLMAQRKNPATGGNADPLPGSPTPVGVGRGGTLTKEPGSEVYPNDRTTCDADRADLAFTDDDQYFKTIYGDANRSNVSFYTIDPRGLVAFDTPIGPDPPPDLVTDRAMLTQRHEVLHTLALATDGMALLDSNNLSKQLGRIADDLTSYYLLGYRSTNGNLDGKYRAIKVRSKRPGIEIRARHGYTAATAAEVAKARAASDVAVPEAKAALTRALGTIETDARAIGRSTLRGPGEPLIFHRGPSTGNQVQPSPGRVFPRSDRIHLELEAADASAWSGALLDRNGAKTAVPVVTGVRTDAASGQRWLTADITLAPLGIGDYVVELTTAQGTEQKKTLVAIRVTQ